jgi:phage gpG-like protein
MGSLVAIEFKFPNWEAKIKAAREEIGLFIAAIMQTNRGLLFDEEGSHNGHPKWAPLKFRVGHILKLTGALSQSMAPRNNGKSAGHAAGSILRLEGDSITIGSNLAYARLMNDGTTKLPGGVLRPAPGDKAIAIPLPSGKKASDYAKSLRGPPRDKDIEQMIADHKKIVDRESSSKKAKAHHKKQIAELKRQLASKKTSYGKKDFKDRIDRLEAEIKIAQRAGKKKETAEKVERLDRWVKKYNDTPKNERVIFRRSVKIPARPFDQWNETDQAEMEAALTNKIAEILNR